MPEIIRRRVDALTRLTREAAGLEERLARSMGLHNGDIVRRSPIVLGSRLETAAESG